MIKDGIIKYMIENFKNMFKDIFSGDKERFKKQFANLLTITRGILSPIFIIISLVIHSLELTFAIILISALTDSFDGWYARKNGYVSEFGKILDAICDKIFSICIIIPVIPIAIPLFIIILIIEMIISLINSYFQVTRGNANSSDLGKLKTIILDATLVICYLSLICHINHGMVIGCLVVTILSQIVTCAGYLYKLKEQLSTKKGE